MSDISELAQRISTALARLEAGVQSLSNTPVPSEDRTEKDSAEVGELRDALDIERTANAQLEERVKAIKGKQEGTVETLEMRVKKLRAQLDTQENEVHQLRRINQTLRETAAKLRLANEANVGDTHLINRMMMAELEALRATRETDKKDVDEVLGELRELVEGVE